MCFQHKQYIYGLNFIVDFDGKTTTYQMITCSEKDTQMTPSPEKITLLDTSI